MNRPRVRSLVPMAHVAQIAESVAFYEKLGFALNSSFTPPGEDSRAPGCR